MRPVLVAHDMPADFRDLLESRFPETAFRYATCAAEVLSALEDCDPEVVFSIKHTGFPGEGHRPAIEHPSVRWLHIGGSGYDHLQGWDGERVTVTNSVGVLSAFLAESVIGGMLAVNGRLPAYVRQQARRVWRPHGFRSLSEQTLLVVGVGHIGGHVAEKAKALGMHVLAIRRSRAPHPAVDELLAPEALHDALGRADVVSLHVRATEETRRLMDRRAFAAMKPSAILINTARGSVVDEAALIEALATGRLGGAYLDVFESEPLLESSPLWTMENVLLTPHASELVVGWTSKLAHMFADNLDRWRAGEPLMNIVPG